MSSTSTVETRRYASHQKSQQKPSSRLTTFKAEQQHRFRDHEDEEKKSDSSGPQHLSSNMLQVPHLRDHQLQHHQEACDDIIRQPQHLMPPPNLERNVRQVNEMNSSSGTSELTYYRVVYRGVVALLSQPESSAPRSGCYLGYGEVVASSCQINSSSIQSAIRVDQVLTGGYAFDPPAHNGSTAAEEDTSETPKKSNIQGYTTTTTTSSPFSVNNHLAISKSSSSDGSSSLNNIVESSSATSEALLRCDHEGVRHYGFVFRRKNNVPIVEPLSRPPKCQHGRFFYKVVSSTPLPILSGPSADAPLSKAMVLPGTIHEVSFRIQIDGDVDDNDVWFLRLGRRKGYIASCRIRGRPTSKNRGNELLVKDVTEDINVSGIQPAQSGNDNDDATNTTATTTSGGNHSKNTASTSSVVLSVLSTSMASSSTLTARNPNRRHRPPRRRRDMPQDNQNARNQRMHQVNQTINNHTSTNSSFVHNDTSTLSNISVQSQYSSDRLNQAPSCNVSLLSEDDSSAMDGHYSQQQTSFSSHEQSSKSHSCTRFNGALSPDRSVARSSVVSHQSSQQQQQNLTYFLMRVTAPRGLRILDAPHFQVNNLIHGQSSSTGGVASATFAPNASADVAGMSGLNSNKNQHHLFHTMAGRLTNTNGAGVMDNAMIFDSVTKTRILPRGAVFEASKRMEASDALFNQGVGLIKLADNSGWAIVPHQKDLEQQYRNFHGSASSVKEGEATRGGYEEIGNAVVFQPGPSESILDQSFSHSRKDDSTASTPGVFMRVVARQGATVVCAPLAPPALQDNHNLSPASSPASSAVTGGTNPDQLALGKSDSTSDVASSVGSSFLDAMFRSKKSEGSDHIDGKQSNSGASVAHVEKPVFTSTTIPCGVCVQVEPHIPSDQQHRFSPPQEFARIKGGQGWLPLFISGKPSCIVCPRRNNPESRSGSFWFRVLAKRGIKVRLGPSQRAPSIKSTDGVYFRFECGEFLRASEVMTVFREDNHGRTVSESFAKLYRNRHVRLAAENNGQAECKLLASLTTQAEWVQVHDDCQNELYLKECMQGPRIERHRQGWRYRIVTRSGMPVKKGPSFEAEDSGVFVEEGESVVVVERVTSPDENGVTWLRMREGKGWLHDVEQDGGEPLLVPHTLRSRAQAPNGRPIKPRRPSSGEKIAYNTIVARLFHNDDPASDRPRNLGR